MALKIVCLEEHSADPAPRSAAQPATMRQTPYYGDLNSRYRDDPAGSGLPALQVVKEAVEKTGEPIEELIIPRFDGHR